MHLPPPVIDPTCAGHLFRASGPHHHSLRGSDDTPGAYPFPAFGVSLAHLPTRASVAPVDASARSPGLHAQPRDHLLLPGGRTQLRRESVASQPISVTTPSGIPAAPGNFTASAISSISIQLNWDVSTGILERSA